MKHIILLFWAVANCIPSYSQITEIGMASFYDDKFDGRITASGETFNQNLLTAAHRTFPFGTLVKITNLENNKTVEVVINDRGPFVNERIIDLSRKAAQTLGFAAKGTATVKIEVVKLVTSAPITTQIAVTGNDNTEHKATTIQATALITKSTVADEALEYYKLESEKVEPQGFGIQVASYQEAANLIKRCSEIQTKTTKEVIVQVADSQGKKVYRIIIGTFATRELAEEYFKQQGHQFPGSFVFAF